MKSWRTSTLVAFVASLLLSPALAFAKPVLSPGELSVGAEFFPFNGMDGRVTGLAVDGTPHISPSIGFNVRYALDQSLAIYGDLAFFHRFREGTDPATFYAVGAGAQFNAISSRMASMLFRGGVQFLPRLNDSMNQVFGARFYVGPGVEARVADALSLQIYSPLLDLQVGGDSTDFDINLMPSLALFVYF